MTSGQASISKTIKAERANKMKTENIERAYLLKKRIVKAEEILKATSRKREGLITIKGQCYDFMEKPTIELSPTETEYFIKIIIERALDEMSSLGIEI